LTTLAVGRYGVRVCNISRQLDKHPDPATRRLKRGLRLERDEPGFKNRLDRLDAAISLRS
jgi:hypothetical protein